MRRYVISLLATSDMPEFVKGGQSDTIRCRHAMLMITPYAD